jgi:hypothetical protein
MLDEYVHSTLVTADCLRQLYKALTHWHTLVLTVVQFLKKHEVSEAGCASVVRRGKHLLWWSPFFFSGATAPNRPGPPHYRGFTIILRHTTLSRTSLDEWSARRRDNTQHLQETGVHATSGIRTRSPASEWPLNLATTGIGTVDPFDRVLPSH